MLLSPFAPFSLVAMILAHQTALVPPVTAELDRYLKDRPGEVSAAVTDLSSGRDYRYNPALRTATASIVKVDVLAALLLQARDAGRVLTSEERALAADMIENSDNDATTALYGRIGGAAGPAEAGRRLGLTETTPSSAWGATTTSAADQIRLLRALTSARSGLAEEDRAYVLDLMRHVAPDQNWGVSAAARPGDTVAVKNGWLPRQVDGGRWTINSIGRVEGHGHDYLIAVVSRRNESMSAGITTVEHVADLVARSLQA